MLKFSLRNTGFNPIDLKISLIFCTTYLIAYTIVLFFMSTDRIAAFCYFHSKEMREKLDCTSSLDRELVSSLVCHTLFMQLLVSLCLAYW